MPAEFHVTGLTETIATLESLPKNIVALGFLKGLEAAAVVLQEEVDRRTPIRLEISGGDLVVAGGSLKSAIMHTITLDSQYRGGFADVGFGKQGWKANLVEYGHIMRGHKPDKKLLRVRTSGTFRVPAYPFMRPAVEFASERCTQVFADTLKDFIDVYVNTKVAA